MPSQDSNIYLPARKEKTCPVHSSFLPPQLTKGRSVTIQRDFVMGPLVPPGPNSHHSLLAVLAFKTACWGREESLGAQKKNGQALVH